MLNLEPHVHQTLLDRLGDEWYPYGVDPVYWNLLKIFGLRELHETYNFVLSSYFDAFLQELVSSRTLGVEILGTDNNNEDIETYFLHEYDFGDLSKFLKTYTTPIICDLVAHTIVTFTWWDKRRFDEEIRAWIWEVCACVGVFVLVCVFLCVCVTVCV